MRKLLFTTVIVFVSFFSAKAQLWLGGSLDLLKNDAYFTFTAAPEIGYGIPDSPWSVAASLGYSTVHVFKYGDKIIDEAFTLAPFVRYNVKQVEKITFFFDIAMEMMFYEGLKAKRFGLHPGVLFKPTDHFAIGLHVGFVGYGDGGLPELMGDKGFAITWNRTLPTFSMNYCF